VAPVWKGQIWYPVLLEMLSDNPHLIPHKTLFAERGTRESSRDNPSVSHLACLKEKYSGSCLSVEASDLMPASWRTKSYESFLQVVNGLEVNTLSSVGF